MPREPKIHVEGLGFPEGPVALPDGSIAFVDLLHASVRVHRDGETRVLAELSGAPNGMRLGPDGALYIANNGGIAPDGHGSLRHADPEIPGCLQRLALDGAWTPHAGDLPGARPNRPNDLVFTPEGDIVFTDPQNWETLSRDPGAYNGGQLLLARRDGRVEHLADMTGFPNGLAFHPDGSLIVGVTQEHRFMRFEWQGGAPLGPGEEWLRLHDGFNPDGMLVHGDRIFSAGSVGDQIAVLSLSGDVIEMIDTPPGSDPTNLCVHDGRLWVTFGLAGQLASYPLA